MLSKISHFIFGILTVLSSKISFILPLIFFLTFIFYELDEEWNKKDEAYQEIREYAVGLTIGLLIQILLTIAL